MDSATEFLLGRSVDSLATPFLLPGDLQSSTSHAHVTGLNNFSAAFCSVWEHSAARSRSKGPWQLLELFGDPTQKDMRVIYDFIDPIIDAEMIKRKEHGWVGVWEKVPETLLSLLIAQTQGEFSTKSVRDEVC